MTSLITEEGIFTVPNPAVLGPKTDEVNLRQGTFVSITVTTINETNVGSGVPIGGLLLRTQTLVTPAITISSVQPNNPATNIPMAIIPKGTGSFLVNIPDNTAVGGNVRGTNAVDLQMSRAAATQVASGNYSIVLCGQNNTASGLYSSSSGLSSDATGDYSHAMGRRAKATNTGAIVFADSTNADFASTTTDQFNARFTNGYRLNGGTFAINDYVKTYSNTTAQTVGAVTTALFTIATVSNTAYIYAFDVLGTVNIGGSASIFRKSIKVKNVGGTVTLGTEFDTWLDADAAMATSSVSFFNSGLDANLIVNVTGSAGVTVNWKGALREISLTI